MAGKVGAHKRPLNPQRVEEMRLKIKTGLIIKVLEDHIISGEEMAPSRITAALGLLRKVIPDYSTVQHTGDENNPIKHSIAVEFVSAKK